MERTAEGLVRKAVEHLLPKCPLEHHEDIEQEISEAYDRAVKAEENAGREVLNPKAMLYTVIRRKILDHLKSKAHKAKHFAEFENSYPDPNSDWTEAIDTKIALIQALVELAERHPRIAQAIVDLMHGDRKLEIAIRMGVSLATIYRWIEIARPFIEGALKHCK